MPQSTYRGDPIGGYLRSLDFSVLGPREFFYWGSSDINGAYAMRIPVPPEMRQYDIRSAYPDAVNAVFPEADTEDLEWMVVYPNQRIVNHYGPTIEELAEHLTQHEAWSPGHRFIVYRKPTCSTDQPEHVATIVIPEKPYRIEWCDK